MNAAESLRRFVDVLEQAGIPYMLTGSYASSFHSVPRATRDLDFVIAPTREQVRALVAALPKDQYYVDEHAALDALNTHSQFKVIDTTTGWKADFIINKPRPFSQSEFSRRYRTTVDGVELVIATAEDVLIAKLEWAKLGSSQRQIEDAVTILRARSTSIDKEYLNQWIERLGIQTQWKEALRVSGIAWED